MAVQGQYGDKKRYTPCAYHRKSYLTGHRDLPLSSIRTRRDPSIGTPNSSFESWNDRHQGCPGAMTKIQCDAMWLCHRSPRGSATCNPLPDRIHTWDSTRSGRGPGSPSYGSVYRWQLAGFELLISFVLTRLKIMLGCSI